MARASVLPAHGALEEAGPSSAKNLPANRGHWVCKHSRLTSFSNPQQPQRPAPISESPASTWKEAQLLARSRFKAPETVWGYFVSAGGVACAYSNGSLRAPCSPKTLDKAGNPSETLSQPHHQELRSSVCAVSPAAPRSQTPRSAPSQCPPWAQPPTWHDSAEGPTSGHQAPSPERHPPAASSVHTGARKRPPGKGQVARLIISFLMRFLFPFKTFLFCEMGSCLTRVS